MWDRTDRAVLAVNGFAADGNMFVKNVKQRLEVCSHTFSPANRLGFDRDTKVVPSCARKGYASSCYRSAYSNYVVRQEILPVLCV